MIRAARRPPGWQAAGPAPVVPIAPEALAPLWPGPNEDLCWLAGNWRILQRTDGHRFSVDDLVTAFTAAELLQQRPPARYLDLGCGIGSVLLFVSWRFPAARATGIEAQDISAGMARRSIAWNGVQTRCRLIEGDFREPAVRGDIGPFDLITGTPPYFPIGTGLQSPEVQRGPCRFEHRGGVEAYCETAAPLLAPGAPLVLCAAPGQVARLEAFAPTADLAIEHRRDVIPRVGKAALFSVFVLRARAAAAPATTSALVVRDHEGARTPEFRAVRAAMGMPP
jgi:tRNA1Val (adenine37-N6)-methyltransferase